MYSTSHAPLPHRAVFCGNGGGARSARGGSCRRWPGCDGLHEGNRVRWSPRVFTYIIHINTYIHSYISKSWTKFFTLPQGYWLGIEQHTWIWKHLRSWHRFLGCSGCSLLGHEQGKRSDKKKCWAGHRLIDYVERNNENHIAAHTWLTKPRAKSSKSRRTRAVFTFLDTMWATSRIACNSLENI